MCMLPRRSLGCIALELALGMVWFSNVWLVPYLEFSAHRRKSTLTEPRGRGSAPQRTAADGGWGGVRGGNDGSHWDETALREFEGAIRANLEAAYSALELPPPSDAEAPSAAVDAAQGAQQMPPRHAAGDALNLAALSDAIDSPGNVMSARVTQLAVDSGVPTCWGEKQAAAAAAATSAAPQRRSAAFARFMRASLMVDFSARESVTALAAHEWLSEPPAATAATAEAAGPRQSAPSVEVTAVLHASEFPSAIHE